MDFLLPPSPQSQAINYAEERQIRPIANLSSPRLHSRTDKSVNNLPADLPSDLPNNLPIEVRSQLEQFLETFPDPDAIARQLLAPQLISQAGPVKVNGIPNLKPSDKPRSNLPPKANTENVGQPTQDIKPVLMELSPLLRNLLKVVSDRQE